MGMTMRLSNEHIAGIKGQSDIIARFWAKVEKTPTCWLWTGCRSTAGYGRVNVRGVGWGAHRLAYVLLVGPIPDGLHLDHVKARGCTNRHCVNPAHLEAVEQRVNTLRGVGFAAVNAQKTHCIHGHEFTPENTRWLSPTRRYCRACHREDERRRAMARRRARERAANSPAATNDEAA